MTVDGVMRIWVEVTVTPPPSAVSSPGSLREPPDSAQQASKAADQVLSMFVNVHSSKLEKLKPEGKGVHTDIWYLCMKVRET